MRSYCLDDTIVAVATPPGEGGIGIVRLSGPEALRIADRIFFSKDGKKPSSYKTYTIHYGKIADRKKGSKNIALIDEVLLTVMRAPKSYTREDTLEINCHGGIQAVKGVLDLAVRCGARIADPGEFTKRAFMNGRIDLVQAEAVLDTIRSKTEASLKVAVNQLDGELSRAVNAIRDSILDMASQLEASIDFPEEDIGAQERSAFLRKAEDALKKIKGLLSTYDEGQVLREGVLATICGKPNVGKSSLMNLLLKRDRVIVSPIPGTTRDTVEEFINLKGVPIRLVDTAGISDTKDVIEKEGVRRSKRYLDMADIVLLVLDASRKLDDQDDGIIRLVKNKRAIVIVNKTDVPRKIEMAKVRRIFARSAILEVSVEKKKNIKLLEKSILDMIWFGRFHQGEGAMIDNARHRDLLDKALSNMLSVKKAIGKDGPPEIAAIDLREAVDNLGLIIGKSVSDDILDRIFQKFCIGK